MANDKLRSERHGFEFRRQLEYKAALSGEPWWWWILVRAKRRRAAVITIHAAVRPGWTCAHVARNTPRNAALNIQREALATVSWTGSHACGEGTGVGRKTP
ncbi:MAG: hypothetical protein IPL59_22365 [Candidatus Competibacteraceae bacterium]|nr:hypothetical protein [Candidatus Competibacteraceae bacterium]